MIGAIFAAGGTALAGISSVLNFVEPAKRELTYTLNSGWPNVELDLQTMIAVWKETQHDIDILYARAAQLGYDKEHVNRVIVSMRKYLNIQDYIVLYRRKKIDYDTLVAFGDRLFIEEDQIKHLLSVTEYFPPAPDLVRFAVREVYTPDVVEKYGMLEDLPEKYLQEAEKAGLPEEQAKNYWASHWQLPSPNMGFEMFQRGIITEDELKTLLRTLDIMPGWRDNLIKLNYNVLTRVDVRRMWDMGVITEFDDLITQYRNVGYSPENARKMADFTVKYTSNEMEGITRANIGDAYMLGIYGEDTLYYYLLELEKSPTFAAFWKEYYIWKRTEKRVREREDEITEMYMNGGIEYDDIRQLLISDGASVDYINYFLQKMQSKTRGNIKQPSRDDVTRWLITGVIPDSTYYRYMRKMGYTDETIQYYYTEAIDPDNPPRRKFLKDDDYINFYVLGYITIEQLMKTFADKGYTLDDITYMIQAFMEAENESETNNRQDATSS